MEEMIEVTWDDIASAQEAFSAEKTVITREYPMDPDPENEPYYPINTPEAEKIMDKYLYFINNFLLN